MNKSLLLALVLGLSGSTYGQVWVGTDYFNSLDTGKWSTSYATSGSAAVSVSGGKLVYTSSGNASGASAQYLWQQSPTTSSNWLAVVDVHVSALTLTTNQHAVATLYATKAGDFSTYLSDKLSLNNTGLSIVSNEYVSGSNITGNNIATSLTDVALVIGYNSTTHLLTSYYDATGSSDGLQLTTISQVDVSSWGNSFNVAIGGASDYFNVTSGDVWLDNFSLQAVLEPSQSVLILMGLVVMITIFRNRKFCFIQS